MLSDAGIQLLGPIIDAREKGTELTGEDLRTLMKASTTVAHFIEILYSAAVHDYDKSKGSVGAAADTTTRVLAENLQRLVRNAAASFDQEEAHTLSHFCDGDNSPGAIAIKIGALYRLRDLDDEEKEKEEKEKEKDEKEEKGEEKEEEEEEARNKHTDPLAQIVDFDLVLDDDA